MAFSPNYALQDLCNTLERLMSFLIIYQVTHHISVSKIQLL